MGVSLLLGSVRPGDIAGWPAILALAGVGVLAAAVWSCRPDTAGPCATALPTHREPPVDPVSVATRADPRIVVRLFGPVRVESGAGRRLGVLRPKSIELLAWLAVHRERATRSSARSDLWTDAVVSASLSNVISAARRALSAVAEPTAGGDWIVRDGDSLVLPPDIVTDAELLEQAVERSRTLPPRAAIEVLDPVVAQLVGPPFDAVSYRWHDIDMVEAELVHLAAGAATTLAELCFEIGDLEGVFRATGRGLRVLPAHEPLVGLRLRAHALAGGKAGLRAEYPYRAAGQISN